jgi:hypothetical protein
MWHYFLLLLHGMAWHGMVVVMGDGVMWAVVWHGIVMLIEVSIKRNEPARETRMQTDCIRTGDET